MQTKEFQAYQNGIDYNNRLEPSFYDVVDANWDFYHGKQWRGARLREDMPKPVFNEIARYVTFFIASIMATKPKVMFKSPVVDDNDNTDGIVNSCWKEFEERVKLVYYEKEALYDGAMSGDFIGHVIFNPDAKPYGGNLSEVLGQAEFELVDPVNFYVSNANTNCIQKQAYIQIATRELVSQLQKESKEVAELQGDHNDVNQSSNFGQIEMEGEENKKVEVVLTYRKKKVETEEGEVTRVFATKATEKGYIYKDVDTGLTMYPVALGNWESQKNTYHGRSFVTPLIPTQIFINRMFAQAMYHTQIQSMPKFIYNKDKIKGISSRVGTQLGVQMSPGESIGNVAGYIAPANMSSDVTRMIELAKTYMQEAVGANDALLGNINPEQASGTAIATASKQAGIPLEIPRANLYNWLEDIARIFYDIIANLYGTRPVVITEGEDPEIIEYDFNQLKNVYKSITVEVGPSSYWSELAVMQTLDNLLERQLIEFVEYLERMPDGFIKDKQGLLNARREAVQGQEDTQQSFLNQLTPEEQQAFMQLPPEEQQAYINQAQGVI